MPFFISGTIKNAVCFKAALDFQHAGTFEVFPVDALYDFCFLGDNDKSLILILGESEEAIAVDLDFALLVAVLKHQLHVLAQGLAFLLGKRSHYGEHDLALGIHAVNIFFLEENGYAFFLKLSDVFQAVQGISGKPADGLCNDHIDATRHALIDHSVEFFTLLGIGA